MMKLRYLMFVGLIMSTTMNGVNNKKIMIIGHRGACFYEPENTLRSFGKAIDLGVDAIELDIFQCKSGELVVFHDRTLQRLTNGHGEVEAKTLAELQQLTMAKGEKIPTLAQLFDFVNRRVIINVEIKGQRCAAPLVALINDYVKHKGWLYKDFVVSSFDHHEIKNFHELCPQVPLAAMITGVPLDYTKQAEQLGADYVVVGHDDVRKEIIDDAHHRGMKVLAYTVNNKDDYQFLVAMGIDGVFSDCPDKLR